ncbi:MAG: TldD/PmbA family protein [Oscillospiraceae bacterium]|nr:TldD/PmbA family protein [Oscillospiraceae bacterium]
MFDIKEVSEKTRSLLRDRGCETYSFKISETEKQELNTEIDEFSLFRTTFDNGISVTTIKSGAKGSSSGNDLTDSGIDMTVSSALLSAESSAPDEANKIAEHQEPEVFNTGVYEPDMDLFYDRLEELINDVTARHPKIKILQIIADHTRTHSIYENSSETVFETFSGAYNLSVLFAGSDGEKTTGMAGAGISTYSLDTPFILQGSIEKQLTDAENSLDPMELKGKFEGTVVFTPECAGQFIYMLISNFASAGGLIEGTSLWKDKLGQKVADGKLSLTLKAEDDRITEIPGYTEDGYRAEDVSLIKNGILDSFLLDLYSAEKTGQKVAKNTSFALVMDPGDTPYEDMVRDIKKGLIVGGFSGGSPGANGEFSGVAKNSFYVEDGKIVGAVSETMINGNLETVFANIKAISRETVCDGSTVLPYFSTDTIVISGK